MRDFNKFNIELKKKINENRDKIGKVLIALFSLILVISAVFLINSLYEYKKGSSEYKELQEIVSTEEGLEENPDAELEDANLEETGVADDDTKTVERITKSGFEKLATINNDVVGWIQFLTIDISYPIVQTDNNIYYLDHTFRKQENKVGTIFMETANSDDLSDPNTFIYGHNMKDGSMFGLLNQYKEKSFYEKNPRFVVSTPNGEYTYDIFSCYVVNAAGDSYLRFPEKNEEYGSYVTMLKNLSLYDTGVQVNGDDNIVILSTCTKEGDDYRFIVIGKQM